MSTETKPRPIQGTAGVEKYTHSWSGIQPSTKATLKTNTSSSANQPKAESRPKVTDMEVERQTQRCKDTSLKDNGEGSATIESWSTSLGSRSAGKKNTVVPRLMCGSAVRQTIIMAWILMVNFCAGTTCCCDQQWINLTSSQILMGGGEYEGIETQAMQNSSSEQSITATERMVQTAPTEGDTGEWSTNQENEKRSESQWDLETMLST